MEKYQTEKNEFSDKFIDFIMKDPEDLYKDQIGLEKMLNKASISISLADSKGFVNIAEELTDELDKTSKLTDEIKPAFNYNIKTIRNKVRKKYRQEFAVDVQRWMQQIFDDVHTLLKFANKVTHMIELATAEDLDSIDQTLGRKKS